MVVIRSWVRAGRLLLRKLEPLVSARETGEVFYREEGLWF